MHSALAFLSGMFVLPAMGFAYAFFYLSANEVSGDSVFWGGCFFGGLLASAAVFPFKRIPHWLAVVLGPAFALLLIALARVLGKHVA
jgi:hypothetical protein